MNQQDLQIRLHVERMIHYGYAALRQFPKSEKHVLSAEIRQCMYRILRLVIVCNRRYYKKTTMQDLDSELDLLRSLVRLSKDLGFLHFEKYETWARHNDLIGRSLGKWMQWMKEEAARRQAASRSQGR